LENGSLLAQGPCALFARRMRKVAYNPQTGQPINLHRPSSGQERQEGVKLIKQELQPPKDRPSKRFFDWVHRPTGPDNPYQYEEPADPPAGVKRPEIGFAGYGAETGVFPPALCKAPLCRSEFGGWDRDSGAPGRRIQDGPWDSMQPPDGSSDCAEAVFLFSDARTKRFPEMKYQPTFHLTTWHLDAKKDVDPRYQPKVHLNDPIVTKAGANPPGARKYPSAGRHSGIAAEGAALSFYDRVRDDDEARGRAPHTAR